MPRHFTTAILGGGPAGCAAAIGLARAGLSVVILERTEYHGERIGETFPPGGKVLLQRLGIWDAFQEDGHLSSPGIVSVWESSQTHEKDFLFSPYGNGWHLDRTRFDRTLAGAAERWGAEIVRSARIRTCITTDTGWSIRYETPGSKGEITARFIVDATGRRAWLAKRQGVRPIILDELVGVVGFGELTERKDHRMFLESTPDGWWYSARLPNNVLVGAFMTDADLLPRGQNQMQEFWKERLRKAPLTSSRWAGTDPVQNLRVARASTARLDRCHGPGWLAVGDAALAFDPLSAQGIVQALASGLRATETITEVLDGNTDTLRSYSEWMQAVFVTYAKNYLRYYGQVRQWPEAIFWRRRLHS